MPKSYSLHRRGHVYYVQFWNPTTARFTSARSTNKKDRDEAILTVAQWLRDGVPNQRTEKKRNIQELLDIDSLIATIRGSNLAPNDGLRIVETLRDLGLIEAITIKARTSSELFIPFLKRFWNYDESPYIREKLAHGQRIGKRHAQDMMSRVHEHWEPFFKDARLCDVSKKGLKDFSLYIADKKLAASTINKTLIAGTTALRWAFENELIFSNPTIGLLHFSGKAEKRGILEPEEAKALFMQTWNDRRAYIANLTASTTGLRMGEILGLQIQDIGKDRLFIRHSWSEKDGLKAPKNGDEREVPLLPAVKEELLQLVAENPHEHSEDCFIFYGRYADRPMDSKPILAGLREALVKLSLGAEEATPERAKELKKQWAVRGIVFHSWRHWYAKMMTDRADFENVQSLTGHRDRAMLEHYADHKQKTDFLRMENVVKDAFGALAEQVNNDSNIEKADPISCAKSELSIGSCASLDPLVQEDEARQKIG